MRSPGSVQLLCGGVGDLLDHLTGQDTIAFTGSAATARRLRGHPTVIGEAVRFNAEADSLNCSILGPDAGPGTEEFELFVGEVVRELTQKTGQKCTAIRRSLVPARLEEAVVDALGDRLAEVRVGDPRDEATTMGPLVSRGQLDEVTHAIGQLGRGPSRSGRPGHGPAGLRRRRARRLPGPNGAAPAPPRRRRSTPSRRSARSRPCSATGTPATRSSWPRSAGAAWSPRSSPTTPASPARW